MRLDAAFKLTDVGLIPEDWQISSLAALTDQKRPISYGIVQTGPAIQNGVRCLRVLDVRDGKINSADVITTSKVISDAYRRTVLRTGDLVMPLRGKVGEVASVEQELAGCNLTRGIALVAIRSDSDALFFKQYISFAPTVNRLEQSMNGSALQEIPIATLRSFKVAFPPTKAEQEAIAEALSDADALIESLEQLLARKRLIKQGTMQELLTGKKRLPGFGGEWEERALLDICVKIQDGTHFSPKLGGNDYLYVTSKNVGFGVFDVSSADTISAAEHAKIYGRCDVIKGDLLLTKDGANTGNAALNTLDEPFSLLSSVAMLRFDSRRHVAAYFLYQILSPDGQRQVKELMSGNAITRLTLMKIRSLKFPVAPLEEQNAIATILSDMDADIGALEEKLVKARNIKQGMMQELLTGRIRLVENGKLKMTERMGNG